MIKTRKSSNSPSSFYYVGLNQLGQKVTGTIDARSLFLAKINLYKQNIIIKKVSKKRVFLTYSKNKKITSKDITLFSRQLATLIQSGIPLLQTITILARDSTKRIKELLEKIKYDIEIGLTFSEALRKYPTYFNKLFCNLVEAGEKSGTLELMLNKIATYKEKTELLKTKIKKALMYPLAVMIVATIITIGLLIFVVPQFETLFLSFGAQLPAMTQAIIHISQFLQSYGYLLLAALILFIYAFIFSKKKSPSFAAYIDAFLLKTPIIGIIIRNAAIARFTRTLSIIFAAGLPLVDALKSAAGVTGNIIFSKATEHIKEEVSAGQEMNKAIKNTQLFPNMVIQMVAIGEESGSLEHMLDKIAEFYEEEVDTSIDSLSHLLEPLIMSILGILVGGLVIAMYLPVFKLGSAI